jgi:hypothetical protein
MGRLYRFLKNSGSLFLRRGLFALLLVSLAMPAAGVSPLAVYAGSPLQAGDVSANTASVKGPVSQTSYPGISWKGPAAVAETTAQIMARQAALDNQPQPAPQPLFNGKVNSAKQVNPASLGLLQGAPAGTQIGQAAGPGSISQLSLGLTFNGPDSTVTPCGLTPPDTMGAVGPTQFIITVNCRFVSYDKTTGLADGVLDSPPTTFFNPVRGGVGVSDPHIRYDRTSGRWFIVMINVAFPDNRIMLAVSNSATITGGTTWFKYSFQDSITGHANCLGDYPTPGIDANAIYIGVNQFCGPDLASSTYMTSDGFVVQKSSVLSGGAIQVTAFPSLVNTSTFVGPFTPQGVDNPDPNATEGYFIGVDYASFGLLQLRRVTNPGTASPTISGNISIPTAAQAFPITQPHMGNTGGTNGFLDASDGRLFEAYFRNGSLWTSLDSGAGSSCTATGPINRDAVFWYEITGIPTGSTPAVHQSGEVCDLTATSPAYYSYGTIMVNGQGHVAVGYTIAGANNFTTPAVSTRLSSDPLSTLTSSANLVPNASFLHAYNPSFDNGVQNGFRRWGDYSYTSVDPCDDMTLWTVQEYASSLNQYGMRVAQLMAPPPAAPASTSPSSVAAGQASLNVTITGASASGSGFYDTPASLTDACRKRISATVGGGVTVNSITFTNPTHVTLNISTVGVTPGAKDVTVTNPDGQSAVGTGILIVTGAANTTTTLVSALNPSTFGQPVKFTATVASMSGTPTGSVTFFDNAASLGTVALAAGSADFTTSALTVGNHPITATYNGDTNFLTSNGTLAGGQVVNKANTILGLVSALNPSTYGQSVKFTATVTSTGGTPTGNVTFFDNAASLGTVALAAGSADFTTSALTVGIHPITATYNGDTSFLTSNGTLAGGQVVNKASTVLGLVSALNPSTYGQSVKFTATVTSTGGTPTGSVTFFDNAASLGTVALAAGSADFSTSSLAAGTHAITASYSGDTNFLTSNGTLSGGQIVNQASTVLSLVPDRNPSPVNQTVKFTATVTSPSGQIPTGSVTITLDGSPNIVALNASGVATLTSGTLAAGTHPVSAIFTGSTNFAASSLVNLSQVSAYINYVATIFK